MDWQQTPLNSFTSWKDALNEAVPASQAPPATRVGRCAVVNGAGMSGLMTAVCLRHSFDTVYIFDKDAADLSIGAKLAPSKVPGQDGRGRSVRPGVPQMQQLHMMQIGGAQAVEAQCPGFRALVRRMGGVDVNFLKDNKGFRQGVYISREDRPSIELADGVCASREVWETALRHCVLQGGSNIRLVRSTAVRSLLYTPDHARVTGVSIVSTAKSGDALGDDDDGDVKGPPPAVTNVPADLVVDASGRESRVGRELQRHGYEAPPVEELKSRLDYATILVCPAATDWPQEAGCKMMVCVGEFSSGMLLPIEGGLVQVNLSSYNGSAPVAKSWEEYLEQARTLPRQDIYDVIKDGQPVTAIQPFTRTSFKLKHFEQGQGMTVGILGAVELQHCLEAAAAAFRAPADTGAAALECLKLGAVLEQVNREFQARLAPIIQEAWQISATDHLKRTEGVRIPLADQVRIWVVDLLLQSTVQKAGDSAARREDCRRTELQLLQTMHMVPQPNPHYLWTAFKQLLREFQSLLATSWRHA
mmetsp:Transcript_16897/g.50452  ORF Transcript_16897/g.50452 Transcript_16897/m.50452 type:complete len:530 (+) Transcript_16897:295-1884(+)